MYDTSTPMPGQTTFTADEEKQMRQSQATINALSAQGNTGAQPASAPTATTPEAGLNPAAYGAGKALGGMVSNAMSGGGAAAANAGNIGGTAGILPAIV